MDVTMDVEQLANFDKVSLSMVVDGKTVQVATFTSLPGSYSCKESELSPRVRQATPRAPQGRNLPLPQA